MSNIDTLINQNDILWNDGMNRLLNCNLNIEQDIILILQKLNIERNVLQKARLYEQQHDGRRNTQAS